MGINLSFKVKKRKIEKNENKENLPYSNSLKINLPIDKHLPPHIT